MNTAILYRISFFVYLAAILIVGSWGYKKIKSASDYFVANRSLGNILSTATFAGAYTSAATILGIVSLNYGLGIQYFTGLNIGIPLGAFLMVILFIRPLRNFAGYTLSDVFVERYGKNVGALSGIIIGISYILLLVP
jgi:SSS family solute:Na+ symporter